MTELGISLTKMVVKNRIEKTILTQNILISIIESRNSVHK